MAELLVTGVRKSFGGEPVLRGVDLRVSSGEFVTLLGPSGCGKTTLLRVIAGLERADTGTVKLGGIELGDTPAERRPVNTVFQNYALFPHLDVFENIAFGLRSKRIEKTEIARRVGSALEMLRLEPLARRGVHQLSGGQKQRVALARALVNEPDALLLDEPMSALDAKLRAELQIELRALQRRLGKTFILVTHDQDEAMTVSDRITVMKEGEIVQTGTPGEVYERPLNRFVAQFLGAANLIEAERISGEPNVVKTALGNLTLESAPPWENGTLAIRPEGIVVRTDPPARNGLLAKVKEAVYRGDHVDFFLEPGDLRARVTPGTTTDSVPTIGSEFWIELPMKRLRILAD